MRFAVKPDIRLKRAYEPPSPDNGRRVLVDRLWPRGLSKVDAAIDCWLKEIAPSTELRRWFNHDPLRWTEFRDPLPRPASLARGSPRGVARAGP